MTSAKGQPPTNEGQTFRTMPAALLLWADGLQAAGCTHVAMASTGVSWRPVDTRPEGVVTLLVVNAQPSNAVPGRKTAGKAADWIAERRRHGRLRGSFSPATPQRQRFPTAKHLASWAGLCPGPDESGGKRLSGTTRNGSRWLRQVLVAVAHVAAHTKQPDLAAQDQRIAARRGKKRALIALGPTILGIVDT